MLSSVDFPQPLWPTRQTNSASSTESETLSSACVSTTPCAKPFRHAFDRQLERFDRLQLLSDCRSSGRDDDESGQDRSFPRRKADVSAPRRPPRSKSGELARTGKGEPRPGVIQQLRWHCAFRDFLELRIHESFCFIRILVHPLRQLRVCRGESSSRGPACLSEDFTLGDEHGGDRRPFAPDKSSLSPPVRAARPRARPSRRHRSFRW